MTNTLIVLVVTPTYGEYIHAVAFDVHGGAEPGDSLPAITL
jgi:hypothetical protein